MKRTLTVVVAVLCLVGLATAQDTQLKGEAAKLVAQYDKDVATAKAEYDAKVAKLQAGLQGDLQKLLSILKGDDPQIDPIKAKIKELQGAKPTPVVTPVVATPAATATAPATAAPLADIKSIIGKTYRIKNGLGFAFDYTFGDGTVSTLWGKGTYKVIGPNVIEATGWALEKRPHVFTFMADGTVTLDRTGDTMPDGRGTGAVKTK
jgi:hypothetical protein